MASAACVLQPGRERIVVQTPQPPLWKIELACSPGNSFPLRKAAFSLSSNNEPSSTFDKPDRFSNGLAWRPGLSRPGLPLFGSPQLIAPPP
jgi:hypothetical protein